MQRGVSFRRNQSVYTEDMMISLYVTLGIFLRVESTIFNPSTVSEPVFLTTVSFALAHVCVVTRCLQELMPCIRESQHMEVS